MDRPGGDTRDNTTICLFKALISILIQHFRSVDRELWYETKGVDPEEEEGVGIMTQVAQDMGGQEPDTHQIQRTFDAFFGNDSLNVPSARNAPQLDGRGIGNSQGADVVLPATMGAGMAPVERTLGLPPESNAVSNDFEEPSMGVDAGADQEMATVVGHTMSWATAKQEEHNGAFWPRFASEMGLLCTM